MADIAVTVMTVTMVGALVLVGVMTVRAHVLERRHLLTCVAATSTARGLVLVCYALAILRDPGAVDPGTGSTAYVVAIGVSAVLAAWSTTTSAWPLRVATVCWGWGLVVVGGLHVTSMVTNPTIDVILVSTIALVVAAAVGAGTWRLERWAAVRRPERAADELTALVSIGVSDMMRRATGATLTSG